MLRAFAFIALSFTLACAKSADNTTPTVTQKPTLDRFVWMEEAKSPEALNWVQARNQESLAKLKDDARYASIETDVRQILLAKDRLPAVTLMGPFLYNLWQDETHVRGLWRRTPVKDFKLADVPWETVLDLDALAKQENENWVWKGSSCLPPGYERCLVTLSRGGQDASVVREFDVVRKSFITNGFQVPEAKSSVAWIDENSLFVSTDFGPGTLSDSGYPIVTKRWQRGTPLSSAVEVFRGQVRDVSAQAAAYINPEGTFIVESRGLTFFGEQDWILSPQGERLAVPLPISSSLQGVFDGRLIYVLREDLNAATPTGSLVALPVANLKDANALSRLETIFTPTSTAFLSSVSLAKGGLLLSVLDNVHGRVLQAQRAAGGKWVTKALRLPGDGMGSVGASDIYSDQLVLEYTDFLTPTSMLLAQTGKPSAKPVLIKQAQVRFDASPFVSEQRFATSRDGTKVPYFIIHKKNMPADGSNPALIYGYGGFEDSMTPRYLGLGGKLWLERGGVYVLANIRGGAEYGPAWHQAALREHRQRAYDDFIAVAEDLISSRVSSPARLAIQGGSNGGLLTGAVFVERPDLFQAVISEVPLLDMIRYPLIGAGASWMEEYGDPQDPKMRDAILKYSPYQNLKAGVKYPEVFFLSSTEDDRVTPAHARKMVALMRSMNMPVLYFENTEGGHQGSANLEQEVLWYALEYTYLWRKLEPGAAH
jgi:prolyl oligopeptidase